jgi:hypothetical protein
MPYIGQTIKTVAKCIPEKSYVEKDRRTSNPVENLSTYFESNTNLFIGQCGDEKCSQVGAFCKVFVR